MTTMGDHEGDLGAGPKVHPLKIFDLAKSQHRYVYACAPMVRYSKLAFRQTVHHFNTDLCWTPMMLAKEFNRNQFARDSDFTVSSAVAAGRSQPVTIAQFGSNSAAELSRAATLVAPYVSGVDLNCGCPQSWACAETLGAALMERRELVREMVVETRARLRRDGGWAVGLEADRDRPDGRARSVSVKIRVHKDLRRTLDFVHTVLGGDADPAARNIDFLTIHPRTRSTPSSQPINLDALRLLTDTFGHRLPILVSGDVFALGSIPYHSPALPTMTVGGPGSADEAEAEATSAVTALPEPHLPGLAGLMSARALLANPALFAGHDACPWEAVDVFMSNVARAPLPLKLGLHHLTEMCGAGYGPDKRSLLSKKERVRLLGMGNWVDVVDFLDDVRRDKDNSAGSSSSGDGVRRLHM